MENILMFYVPYMYIQKLYKINTILPIILVVGSVADPGSAEEMEHNLPHQ